MGKWGNLELILSLWDPRENGAEFQVKLCPDKISWAERANGGKVLFIRISWGSMVGHSPSRFPS